MKYSKVYLSRQKNGKSNKDRKHTEESKQKTASQFFNF